MARTWYNCQWWMMKSWREKEQQEPPPCGGGTALVPPSRLKLQWLVIFKEFGALEFSGRTGKLPSGSTHGIHTNCEEFPSLIIGVAAAYSTMHSRTRTNAVWGQCGSFHPSADAGINMKPRLLGDKIGSSHVQGGQNTIESAETCKQVQIRQGGAV